MEACEVYKLIPKEELQLKLNYGTCELSPDFMCFEENYLPVARTLPKDFTIVDLGCYQAAQSYLFKDFERYIGVDYFDVRSIDGFRPPLRFYCKNAVHYSMRIEGWFEECRKDTIKDDSKTYYIMSAVPGYHENSDWLFDRVKNALWSYPGQGCRTKGVYADEILDLWKIERNKLENR